jgi:hypothetical protein
MMIALDEAEMTDVIRNVMPVLVAQIASGRPIDDVIDHLSGLVGAPDQLDLMAAELGRRTWTIAGEAEIAAELAQRLRQASAVLGGIRF